MPRTTLTPDGRRSIQILLPVEMVNAVDRLRYEYVYRSRSAVITEAVRQVLDRVEPDDRGGQAQGDRTSSFD